MILRRCGILAGIVSMLFIFPKTTAAQSQPNKKRKGEIYFSWGYNTEWYTRSTVKINQPDLNNHYSFEKIKGHDHPGWDEGLFSKALTIPQYNYRIGYFLNDKNDLGIEINFDHTKFIIEDNQQMRMKGTFRGRTVDSSIVFSEPNGFYYFLNNGANFLLFNIVKRWHWYSDKAGQIKIDALGKAGVGPVIPHVQNSLFGDKNEPGFQIGGWNTGVEGAIRSTFFKHAYLEFAGKLDYARYSGLKVYKGTAKQAFGTVELILSLGATF